MTSAQQPMHLSRRDWLVAGARGGAFVATAAVLHPSAASSASAEAATPIVGTWLVTTTDPTPSIVGIISHTAEGVVIPSHPNPALSAGHGAWAQTGDADYLLTFVYLRRDAQGQLLGTQKVRRAITLDATGNRFTGTFQNELLDLAENVERASTGSVQGTRIVAEPFV